jgi:glycosyltransferase involved in cell wall biosynthesis
MKCSIIMAVLDSHEFFRRQMRRFDTIVPPDFEVIVLDDGSDIPLKYDDPVRFPFTLIHTNDKRPWTNDLARNRGAAVASGEYLLMLDVDHVLTPEILDRVRHFRGDMLKFHRQVADLDEHGQIRNPREALATPPNIFAIRKTLFDRIGGYNREYVGYGADRTFREKYQRLVSQGQARPFEVAETIYVVTEGKWFHNLKRIGARSAAGHRRDDARTRLPLVFSGSPVRPVEP